MKNANAIELNEKFKNCPTERKEIVIDGKIYAIYSHFVGTKDLDEIIRKNAYERALNETLAQ